MANYYSTKHKIFSIELEARGTDEPGELLAYRLNAAQYVQGESAGNTWTANIGGFSKNGIGYYKNGNIKWPTEESKF